MNSVPKILCIIPARGGSKRAPSKNIRLLCNKPLIAFSIESALESKLCTKVVVSTDDVDIAQTAKDYGAEVIARPAELAMDTSPLDDALRHAVRFIETRDKSPIDIVVLLQANVPIRKKGEIDAVIKKLIETKNATAVGTVYKVEHRPEWMKKANKETGTLEPFMGHSEFYRKQDLPELFMLDGAVLAIWKKTLMETEGITRAHGYLGENIFPFVHDAKYSIEIDEESDFGMAEYWLRKGLSKN